jgi:transcriptional repressor NrdR
MKCPECQTNEIAVMETRSYEEGAAVRRRRKCLKCGFKFNTLEKVELVDLKVQKRDGSVEQFDREKIKRGIVLACKKRPVSFEVIEKISEEIEEYLVNLGKRIVDSKEIGEQVMIFLKDIDKVAYMRFASVCRYFDGIDHFQEELENLKD